MESTRSNEGEAGRGPDSAGPLDGVRVLDVTHVMAGSWCGCLLGQMGADVVKIEPVRTGEDLRATQARTHNRFRPFDAVNYGKRSLAIDLDAPRGVETLRRLSRHADVFVENYRPGALERRGLGYADLSKENEALVYASISGFGGSGPARDQPGFDLVAQATSGILSVTGEAGRDPVAAGVPIADLNAGNLAAMGILSAWIHRLRTGRGQRVETSLFEAALALTIWESAQFFDLGRVARPNGARHRLAAPYGTFATADGFIAIGAGTQASWLRLCEALERPDLRDDARFTEQLARLRHRDELEALLGDILRREATDEWLRRLDEHGVPCGPVLDMEGVWSAPQTLARNMLVEAAASEEGVSPRRVIGPAVKLSQTPWRSRPDVSSLGADSRSVLAEAGFEAAEIADLLRDGAIGCADE